jgi:hypothetical protein
MYWYRLQIKWDYKKKTIPHKQLGVSFNWPAHRTVGATESTEITRENRHNEHCSGTCSGIHLSCPLRSLCPTSPCTTHPITALAARYQRSGKPNEITQLHNCRNESINQSIYSFINGSQALRFVLLTFSVGTTPWMGDQPDARPLPTHRTVQTQNKRTYRYQRLQ